MELADANAVRVDGLTKVFRSRRRGDTLAVDNVSFSVARNEIVGLLGANGAGKTTTIKCLCGLIIPTSGEVIVNGHDVIADPTRAGAHVGAVLEGNRNLYWRLTVRDNIEFFAGLQGISLRSVQALRDELIERFGLTEKARTQARMLSRGMQQKLSLACCLARQTPIIVLDEPTLGLDVETSHELRVLLRQLAAERTILVSSHDMATAQQVCDRVVVLVGGRVVADDRVRNLLALFRAQAYQFLVEGTLTSLDRAALVERFAVLSIEQAGTTTSITVEFADDEGLYDLVDILRRAAVRVVGVERNEPDLEQVFLHLVKGARS